MVSGDVLQLVQYCPKHHATNPDLKQGARQRRQGDQGVVAAAPGAPKALEHTLVTAISMQAQQHRD